ncbi:Cytochrome c553 [Halopseudomonas xinjiangensis]|uniref:Cytochrome c553 n=1 Tax=Halopseudomonas xinjiangensis TaxID=487184 RepID=A0A1H1TXP2_9GAMM|nr:c-type cytochrome [Halopseudomonas xinjiangensis]SDS64844.1 Cytochrome c553 [Halopseudomonas xinjiangensis]
MLRSFLERFFDWLGGSLFRRLALGVALVLLMLGAGALALTSAGLVSISASSGHWPVTSWFLHYSMRRAVSTQSLGIEVPENLADPALIFKGAGHFETGCLVCHGAPGRGQSLIAQQMTPEPPYLPSRISRWEPQELFWIVRHGIKFTAMPAWPALKRDDEVWAVVAFLQQLPEMSPERYRQLAFGERAENPAAVAPEHLRSLSDPLGPVLADCARCHGPDGGGRATGAFPILAGQNQAYLLASLKAYASGSRASGVMQPIAAGLDDEVLGQLAEYYAQLPPVTSRDEAQPDLEAVARGSELAAIGAKEQKVPSCIHCHGPSEAQRNRMYPVLAGQYPDYLALQLQLFAAGERGGTEYAEIMHSAAQRLTPDQMRDLAQFYASLERANRPEQGNNDAQEP